MCICSWETLSPTVVFDLCGLCNVAKCNLLFINRLGDSKSYLASREAAMWFCAVNQKLQSESNDHPIKCCTPGLFTGSSHFKSTMREKLSLYFFQWKHSTIKTDGFRRIWSNGPAVPLWPLPSSLIFFVSHSYTYMLINFAAVKTCSGNSPLSGSRNHTKWVEQ